MSGACAVDAQSGPGPGGTRSQHRSPLPAFQEGDAVDVVLISPEIAPQMHPRKSVLEIIKELPPGLGMFKTAKEVDDYLREERDAWDR